MRRPFVERRPSQIQIGPESEGFGSGTIPRLRGKTARLTGKKRRPRVRISTAMQCDFLGLAADGTARRKIV